MKFSKNQEQISLITHLPTKIGKINTNTIENNLLISDALFKLKKKLIDLNKQQTKSKTKKFQVGVYVIYAEYDNQNILYIGATKNYVKRISNHQAAFNSTQGHINKTLQEFYNKIKLTGHCLDNKISHYQILDKYFTFLPLYCYNINCSPREMESRSVVDYLVQNLETQVIEAFLNNKQFNVSNIGPTLNQESFQSMTMPMLPEKKNYYNKLKDLATAQVLEKQNQNNSSISNLTDFSAFSAQEIKNLKNASRKIRPIVSMQTNQFFSSYNEVCQSNIFEIANPDKISQLAKRDNPSLPFKDRNFRFASDQEIAHQKSITNYNSRFNPGSFNSQTRTVTKTVPVIGPIFNKKTAISDADSSTYRKNTAFSLNEQKAYYPSKAEAATQAGVSPNAIAKWIKRDITLYKENMPVIWREASHREIKEQKYIKQLEDVIPKNYSFSKEKTMRTKTNIAQLVSKANKGVIVPDKNTNKPRFFSSTKDAQEHYGWYNKLIKKAMTKSEIAFLENQTPRQFRVASLEENQNQSYIKKYDTLPKEEILKNLPKKKFEIDAKITLSEN